MFVSLLGIAACTPGTINVEEAPPGIGPDIAVTDTLVYFGDVALGADSTVTVTVTNEGDEDLTLGGITLEDATAGFSLGALATTTLAPAETTTFDVYFAASTMGTATTMAYLESDDPDEPEVELQLVGNGASGALTFEPASYDFGGVVLGCYDTYGVALLNAGTEPLQVTGVSASGGGGAFTVDTSDAGPLPWTLEPGVEQLVWIGFTPGSEGAASGDLAVTSDDPANPNAAMALDGTGLSGEAATETFTATGSASFVLSSVAWPDSLIVTVNGNYSSSWTYSSSSNAVVFEESETPAPGAEVAVRYDAIPDCSG